MVVVTDDSVTVSALVYGAPHADVAIVFGHGFTGSQRNHKVVQLARFFAATGYAFYTADFRGHGVSGGHSTLGEAEVLDFDAVVKAAKARHPKVICMGASMGAFVALRHAALMGGADAVIAISSPATYGDAALLRAKALMSLTRTARRRRVLKLMGARVADTPPAMLGPIDVAPSIAPTPVVIVHGTKDHYVPLSHAHRLYANLREPRRLVVVKGFGHAEAGFSSTFALMLGDLVADLSGNEARSNERRRAIDDGISTA
jgi:pimeloyl-ACP methyl ester carboxylesterase